MSNRYVPISTTDKIRFKMVTCDSITYTGHWPINYNNDQELVEMDFTGDNIILSRQLEGYDLLLPTALSLKEYYEFRKKEYIRTKFIESAAEEAEIAKTAGTGSKIELIGADIGGQRVSLRVSGNININGKLQNQQRSQVAANYREGKSTSFIIDQKQQLNIEGTIGDRISILVDQDSERDFDFENNMRIHYTGHEDEIVQKVEAGNISLSLPGTKYVTFSSSSSGLFGIKSEMKLGGINITSIASMEKGKKEKMSYEGGAQATENSVKDYEYVKNVYFYLDETYRNTFYQGFFENGGRFTYDPNRVVTDLEVYKSQFAEQAGTIYGEALVDPENPDQFTDEAESRVFRKLELDKDYFIDRNLGFIKLFTRVQNDEVLAVSYRVTDSDGNTVEEYGDYLRAAEDTTNIALKMIKPPNMLPDHPCWPLMFKNVYYLGATNINKKGFELKVVYIHGESGDEERDRKGDNNTFLNKFGLDEQNESGENTPDDLIDLANPAVINLVSGELWFPFLHPFEFDSLNTGNGSANNRISPEYSCTAMYTENSTTGQSQISNDQKFKIVYKYENRSSIINLGPMIIENSEEITLGGTKLTKGVDYSIDYWSGTLTLLRKDATNPDAKLDIKFEKNQFFQLDKKTILGTRAQWDFGEKSFIGGTALYYSKSVVDEKVDVGYEPMRNFVWDLNGRFSRDFNFITRALDKLPVIETDRVSTFKFEGEIARVNPNPNTINNAATGDPNGVAFIDDFEGAKRVTSPPIMRRYWARSAPPISKKHANIDNANYLQGYTMWYNPYGGVFTKDIWPDKQTSTRAQNNITEIMVFSLNPDWASGIGENASEIDKQKAWGGITYFFPTSYRDQSKTKFMEIWIKGNSGHLHVDLGRISEDQIPDNKLNTEDKPEAGFTMGNKLLDNAEDTGLDGVFDEDETVTITQIDGTVINTLGFGDEQLQNYARNKNDPHTDNFDYENGSTNYRFINGTEGNENDVGGKIPDSEDMDNNYVIDNTDDYMSVDFWLDNKEHEYIAGKTEKSNGNPTGWKLYRIPLTDFELAKEDGSISFEDIRACRLWFDGAIREDSMYIAKVEMVGNEWEEMGIASGVDSAYVKKDENFAVSVINTEDNPDIYEPPKGVQGEYDRVNEIRSKEQSLVFNLYEPEGLGSNEICAASKDLLEEASYILYKKMKIYINGHNIESNGIVYGNNDDLTPLSFYFRFGKRVQNSVQFYEYKQPVYVGWAKENEIKIDLDFVTRLKAYNYEEDYPDNEEGLQQFFIERDEEGIIKKRIYKEVKENAYTGKEITIYGNPAIGRIKRLEMGLINESNYPVSGEVWVDELRLSEVRRSPGVAYRSDFTFNLADLANFSVNVSKKNADFHRVEEQPNDNVASLKTAENMSARGSLSLHKFTPAKWGLSIPVSASYSENKSTPKYLPGSDILAGETPPDSIIDLSHSYGLNTSFSKSRSDFWLMKYTLDQVSLGFNAKWQESSNVTTMQRSSESYSGNFSYGIPFGRDNYFEIFKWASEVPVIGTKLSEIRLYYTPNKLSYKLTASESKNQSIPRWGEVKPANYNFGMNQSYNFGYKMFDNLSATFSRSTKNDLRDLRGNKQAMVRSANFGVPIDVKETYNLSLNPKIFSWFNPNMSYSSNYTWGESYGSPTESVDRLSNNNRISTSVNLNLASIVESLYSPKSSGASSTGGRGRRTGRNPGRRGQTEDDIQKPEEEDKEKENIAVKVLKVFHDYLAKIQPINCTYSMSQSAANKGRVGTPGLGYRLGFETDPNLPIIEEEAGTGKNNLTKTQDMSLRSGLKITTNINTSFNYAQNSTSTFNQGIENENHSQDFLPLGKTGRDGMPFPGYSLSVSGLHKIKFLSSFLQNASLNHGFSGKETKTIKDGEETQSTYRIYFQPLFGMQMQFKGNINSSLRYTQGRNITNREAGTSITDEMNISGTLSWKHRGGININLPFFKKELKNNIDLNLTFDYNSSITKQRNQGGEDTKFTVTSQNEGWKAAPRITYSFTQKVSGGIFFTYGESKNKHTGKRITRDFGFDVNIAIRG